MSYTMSAIAGLTPHKTQDRKIKSLIQTAKNTEFLLKGMVPGSAEYRGYLKSLTRIICEITAHQPVAVKENYIPRSTEASLPEDPFGPDEVVQRKTLWPDTRENMASDTVPRAEQQEVNARSLERITTPAISVPSKSQGTFCTVMEKASFLHGGDTEVTDIEAYLNADFEEDFVMVA